MGTIKDYIDGRTEDKADITAHFLEECLPKNHLFSAIYI